MACLCPLKTQGYGVHEAVWWKQHASHEVALGTIAGMADVQISSLNAATSASMTPCNWMSCWSMRVERS
jgi:hypothetical protein